MRRGLGLHESRWEGDGRHGRRRHSSCKRLSYAGLRRWAGGAEGEVAGLVEGVLVVLGVRVLVFVGPTLCI